MIKSYQRNSSCILNVSCRILHFEVSATNASRIPVYSFQNIIDRKPKPNTMFQLCELKKERELAFVRNFCEMSAGLPSNQFREKKSIRQLYHANLPRFTTFRNRDFKIACKFHAGTTLPPTTACNVCVSLHAVYYWPR